MSIEHQHIEWPEDYPTQLADIGNVIADGLARIGLARDRIGPTALDIVEHIRRECGGAAFYLSRGAKYELSRREEKIWREFDGRNYYQLAKQYGLSEVRIRSIVKRAKARDQARRQHTLFDDPAARQN